jgi:hypothetical protein
MQQNDSVMQRSSSMTSLQVHHYTRLRNAQEPDDRHAISTWFVRCGLFFNNLTLPTFSSGCQYWLWEFCLWEGYTWNPISANGIIVGELVCMWDRWHATDFLFIRNFLVHFQLFRAFATFRRVLALFLCRNLQIATSPRCQKEYLVCLSHRYENENEKRYLVCLSLSLSVVDIMCDACT